MSCRDCEDTGQTVEAFRVLLGGTPFATEAINTVKREHGQLRLVTRLVHDDFL